MAGAPQSLDRRFFFFALADTVRCLTTTSASSEERMTRFVAMNFYSKLKSSKPPNYAHNKTRTSGALLRTLDQSDIQDDVIFSSLGIIIMTTKQGEQVFTVLFILHVL